MDEGIWKVEGRLKCMGRAKELETCVCGWGRWEGRRTGVDALPMICSRRPLISACTSESPIVDAWVAWRRNGRSVRGG